MLLAMMESTARLAVLIGAATLMSWVSGCGSLIVTQQSVESLADSSGFTWEMHEFDGWYLYVEAGSPAADNVETLSADAVSARQRVLAYLQEASYEPTVSIFVVSDRDRMKDLVGRRSNGTGYYTSNALCLVGTDGIRHGATHELLHVITMNLWGVPQRWVNEGAAVDATGPWQGYDVHAVCKTLQAEDALPSLRDLTHRFDKLPSLVKYPAAGSFVRYLRKNYGIDSVHRVWHDGRSALPDVTGMELAALEAAWLEVVEQSDATGVEYTSSPRE
jgi:hypothetical protein